MGMSMIRMSMSLSLMEELPAQEALEHLSLNFMEEPYPWAPEPEPDGAIMTCPCHLRFGRNKGSPGHLRGEWSLHGGRRVNRG